MNSVLFRIHLSVCRLTDSTCVAATEYPIRDGDIVTLNQLREMFGQPYFPFDRLLSIERIGKLYSTQE